MQVELDDYENGRPIFLKADAQTATKIKELKAKKSYKEILEVADAMPNTRQKYFIKANAELHLKKWKELSDTCDKGLEFGEDSDFCNLKGKAVGKLGNFQEKVQLTKRAIVLDSSVPAYHRNLGAAYYKLKEYEKAIVCHTRAIDLEPSHSINYHNKGAAFFRMSKYQQAKEQFGKAVELDKKQVISYSWLGDSEKELGNYEKAKELYLKAYDLSKLDAYKQEAKKMDQKIDPDKKKGFFSRIFG